MEGYVLRQGLHVQIDHLLIIGRAVDHLPLVLVRLFRIRLQFMHHPLDPRLAGHLEHRHEFAVTHRHRLASAPTHVLFALSGHLLRVEQRRLETGKGMVEYLQ
jgi:hypothetical protein